MPKVKRCLCDGVMCDRALRGLTLVKVPDVWRGTERSFIFGTYSTIASLPQSKWLGSNDEFLDGLLVTRYWRCGITDSLTWIRGVLQFSIFTIVFLQFCGAKQIGLPLSSMFSSWAWWITIWWFAGDQVLEMWHNWLLFDLNKRSTTVFIFHHCFSLILWCPTDRFTTFIHVFFMSSMNHHFQLNQQLCMLLKFSLPLLSPF